MQFLQNFVTFFVWVACSLGIKKSSKHHWKVLGVQISVRVPTDVSGLRALLWGYINALFFNKSPMCTCSQATWNSYTPRNLYNIRNSPGECRVMHNCVWLSISHTLVLKKCMICCSAVSSFYLFNKWWFSAVKRRFFLFRRCQINQISASVSQRIKFKHA